MGSIPSNYYTMLAGIESSNDPYAQAGTSSASGLYQFTKGTWKQLGYDWSNVFNVADQQSAIQKLTSQNATTLSNAGIPIDNASLYAAHFLGAGTATTVLGASDSSSLASLVSPKVISSNSFLSGMNVGDFKNWLATKTGSAGGSLAGATSSLLSKAGSLLGEAGSVASLANPAAAAIATVTGGIGNLDPFAAIAQAISSFPTTLTTDFQSWLFNSSFFTRIALAIFAIILLIAGFMMLKPVQQFAGNAAKLAASGA